MCVLTALKINSNNDFFFLKRESGRASFEFGGLGIKMEKRAIKDMGTQKNGKITSVNKRKSYINECP